MKRMLFLFVLILTSLFAFAPFVHAETCSCWCESNSGAYTTGDVADVATCQDACGDYLGCYAAAQKTQEPQYNTLCWSEYECMSTPIQDGIESEWGGQERTCLSGEGYCYSEPIPVKLNVAIGSFTQAESFGDYVNAAYSWLLTAASLLAVVMLMLGGLQYMLARGNTAAIGKATDRIRHAVVGIILLFGSYAIANMVDPHFVTFNRLSPPRVRKVVFLDPSSTCEAMAAAGVTITPVAGSSCGDTGTITDLGTTQSSLTVGSTCTYSTCESWRETCMSTTETGDDVNNGYTCVRCGTAHLQGLSPSAATCSALVPHPKQATTDEHFYCVYYAGFAELGFIDTSCREIAYPVTFWGDEGTSLNCQLLEEEHGASCRAYDFVQGSYVSAFDVGEPDVEWDEIDDMELNASEYPLMEAVCLDDPCGFAPPGESCVIYANDPSEEAMMAIVATGVGTSVALAIPTMGVSLAGIPASITLAAAAWVAGDELVANCANQSAELYGMWNCKDRYGNDVSCDITEIDIPGF